MNNDILRKLIHRMLAIHNSNQIITVLHRKLTIPSQTHIINKINQTITKILNTQKTPLMTLDLAMVQHSRNLSMNLRQRDHPDRPKLRV